MTHVKFNRRPFETSFENMFDDLINGLPVVFNGVTDAVRTANSVPVNIRETNEAYLLEVVAPGFEKSDFKVNLENNILTISAEYRNENRQEEEKSIRREYTYRNFKRSFTIDEKIDATKIGASYINGILQLNLPKKTEVKEAAKEIVIN